MRSAAKAKVAGRQSKVAGPPVKNCACFARYPLRAHRAALLFTMRGARARPGGGDRPVDRPVDRPADRPVDRQTRFRLRES